MDEGRLVHEGVLDCVSLRDGRTNNPFLASAEQHA